VDSPDELDHLIKLGSTELGCDLLHASLMEEQDSRNDGFGHALSGGPAHIVWIKKSTTSSSAGIYSNSARTH
jgi:hypothetical protein